MAVLTIIVIFVNQMFSSVSAVTALGTKHLDTDSQAKVVFGRMAEDFSQMVKRSDLDFFGKNTAVPNSAGGAMLGGSDSIAFFASVLGYYPSATGQSNLSLVAYRVNSSAQLERMSKGLLWNGTSSTNTPIVFLPLTIAANWATATNLTVDPDYEVLGPQVFRLEYYYQLLTGDFVEVPWDTDQGHTTVSGLRDVGAIIAVIAVIDPQSRKLVTTGQLTTLAAQMNDHAFYKSPGNSGKVAPALQVQWQTATNSASIPKAASVGIHCYQRAFYLNAPSTP